MRWEDPMPINCQGCGGRFPIPVAALRSLQAACPACGASFSTIGKRMLAEERRFRREVDPFVVGFELVEQTGLGISDDELETVRSLDDLARAVVKCLPPGAGREVQAAEVVAAAARRSGCEYLLGEAGSEVVRAWLEQGGGPDAGPGRASDFAG